MSPWHTNYLEKIENCFERYHKKYCCHDSNVKVISLYWHLPANWNEDGKNSIIKISPENVPVLLDYSGLGISPDHTESLAKDFLMTFLVSHKVMLHLSRKENQPRGRCSLHVILACQTFPIRHDWRLSSLVWGYRAGLSFETRVFHHWASHWIPDCAPEICLSPTSPALLLC